MHNRIVLCDYCNAEAELVTGATIYPENPKTHDKHYWHCAPCDAWSACHENSPSLKPVGRLANADLRAAKKAAHDAFDLLWMAGYQRHLRTHGDHANRSDCIKIGYSWLAEKMGITSGVCHIGSFDIEQCEKARLLCVYEGNELLQRFSK